VSHRICPAGEALVGIGGELDIATADLAAAGVPVAFDLDGPGGAPDGRPVPPDLDGAHM
jgi:hypothetical protein